MCTYTPNILNIPIESLFIMTQEYLVKKLIKTYHVQFVQYPGTFFYYRWRNNSKAKKWDAMTPEQQHEYRQTTADTGNKR